MGSNSKSSVPRAVLAIIIILSAYAQAVRVTTEPRALLQKGTRATLPCSVDRDVAWLTWSQGHTPTDTQAIIVFENDNGVWRKWGPGYGKGYDIEANFSLLIQDVAIADEGFFVCEVLDKETSLSIANHTYVNVFARPAYPFPVIDECHHVTGGAADNHECHLSMLMTNITCSVAGYFPNISLSIWHGEVRVENAVYRESNYTDGTKNKSVTVLALSSDEPYVCVASDIPGSQEDVTQRSSAIFLVGTPDETSTDSVTPTVQSSNGTSSTVNHTSIIIKIVIPVLVLIVAIVIIVLVLVVCRKKRPKGKGYVESLEDQGEDLHLMEEPAKEHLLTKIDDIHSISAALKLFYRDNFRETKTSALDPKSVKKLEQIFVNLSLLRGNSDDKPENISYERMIRVAADGTEIARIAIVGEAGVGKTTLLTKIAYDWATEKHLLDIDMLLYVPLRETAANMRLSDVVQMYVPRGVEFKREVADEFTRSNPGKVMFLMDGLDEYHGDIRNADPTNILTGIMRGDEFKRSPTIVATRPWRAHIFISLNQIKFRYTRIVVKGFTKKDVKEYINKFFDNDTKSASSLIKLMTEDTLVAENMAPYPIFCCMLCNIWKDISRRKLIKTFRTFSQLFEEMIFSLKEHWLAKTTFRDYRSRCENSLKQIGKIAFEGLLNNQLVFTEETFEDCMEAMETCCEIGVLSSEKRFAAAGKESKDSLVDVSFPHKLFQEYLAGLHLASLYLEDKPQFWRLVQDNVLPDYQNFKYLLYFTVAHGKEPGHAGRELMERICIDVKDNEFIVDVAFEYQSELSTSPVVEFIRSDTTEFKLSERLQILHKHTWSGYVHAFAVCGRDTLMIHADDIKQTSSRSKSVDETIKESAVGLITLPHLHILTLDGVRLAESFYKGMVIGARYSQIEKFAMQSLQLDSKRSKLFSQAIFNLTKLHTLELNNVIIGDTFYTVMFELGPASKVEELIIHDVTISADVSKYFSTVVFSMTHLRTLHLQHVKLDKLFFTTMVDVAHKSKVEQLTLDNCITGPVISHEFAKGLSVMTELRSLRLFGMKLDANFFTGVVEYAPWFPVETIDIGGIPVSHQIIKSVVSLPLLQSVRFTDLSRQPETEQNLPGEETTPEYEIETVVVDAKSLVILRDLGLDELCPRVQSLTLEFRKAFSMETIAIVCSSFPHLAHLELSATPYSRVAFEHPTSFCKKLATSLTGLKSLTFTDMGLGNDKAVAVIRNIREQGSLKRLRINRCNTDAEVDQLIAMVNVDGSLHVTVNHT